MKNQQPTSNSGKISLLAMAFTGCIAGLPVARASSFVGVNDGGGAGWTTSTVLPNAQVYRSLSVDRVRSQTIYGINTAGRPYDVFVSGVWIEGSLPSVPSGNSYLAITADANTSQFTYASRTTGGIDAIHVWPGDGNWYTDFLGGSATYTALASSMVTGQTVFSAKSTGGLDIFDPTAGYWAARPTVSLLDGYTFVSLAANPKVTAYNYLFGVATDGLTYKITDNGGWNITPIPTPAGRTYTSITSSNFVSEYAFATRSDGGMDAIHVWPGDGNWYADTLVSTGTYGVIAADLTTDNYIYASSVPEPTTFGSLGAMIIAASFARIRRKGC